MSAETDAAMINMSSQVLNSALSYAAASSLDYRTREYNKEMYKTQREDALADWNRQNEYNSPLEQMNRLKAAGLNPNLVYGKGAEATSSSMPRGVEAKSWSGHMPNIQLDGASVLNSFYDAKVKEQTLNNMKAQQKVQEMDALLRAAQTTATNAGTASTLQNTQQKGALFPTSLQIQEQTVAKMLQDMDISRQQNERAAVLQGEQILNMVQQRSMNNLTMEQMNHAIELLKKDERIKELDAQFADKGVRPNDSMMWKVIAEIIQRVSGKKMWDLLK